MQIIHYDLFAGIGGFSLALDTIFNDHEIKHIFCERDPFATAVLKKHWPDGTYFGDIHDLVADTNNAGCGASTSNVLSKDGETSGEEREHAQHGASGQDITILTGGFPCQPFSHAGRRQGTADDRYLWPHMLSVITNVKPDWVIAENVRGLVTWNDGLVLETVCVDLEAQGYEVQPLIIPAVAIGAPHRRDRVWIIANRKHERPTRREYEERPRRETKISPLQTSYSWGTDWREVAFATCHDGVDDGLPRQMGGVTISASRHRKEQLKCYGNSIVPQVAMEIFEAIKSTK